MHYNLVIYCIIISIISIYLSIKNEETNENLKYIIDQQEEELLKLHKQTHKQKHKYKQKQYNNQEQQINNNQQYDRPQQDPVYMRDQMVLTNRLYPPLARTDRPQFDILMNQLNNNNGVFNINTRGSPDTYRQVGYLTPINKEQTIDSTLILYGRAKYPNSDLGEFYITSSNKISDIKIPLNEYNSNIRRITDIPYIINIRGTILNGQYNFTELPKGTLDNQYI